MKKSKRKWFHRGIWQFLWGKIPFRMLFLLFFGLTLTDVYAQVTVTGTVRDSKGTSLPGVSVTIKGMVGATSTSVDGIYSIRVPQPDAVLIFSFISFNSQEETLKGRSVIDIELQESNKNLQEVVVVAFGTQKKTDVIGAVTSINPSDLKVPSSNLTTALAGRLSGVIAINPQDFL